MNTIIISSERDRLGIEYLKRVVGEAKISAAVAKIPAGNKPYISNVARILKIEIPKDLQPATRTENGNAGLAAARQLLAKLKGKPV